jgi:hypothetical protein
MQNRNTECTSASTPQIRAKFRLYRARRSANVWFLAVALSRLMLTRLSAIGYWLLAIGYWLLAIGYWLLAIGYWLLAICLFAKRWVASVTSSRLRGSLRSRRSAGLAFRPNFVTIT